MPRRRPVIAGIAGLTACAGAAVAQPVLMSNGPLTTAVPRCILPPDAPSELQVGNETLGFGAQATVGNRIADDFAVPSSGWVLTAADLFLYQTGAMPSSPPVTSVSVRIWDARPGDAGSRVVAEEFAQGSALQTAFASIFRIGPAGTACDMDRPIFRCRVKFQPPLQLPPGRYWMDFSAAGQLASGPWAPPVTIAGTLSRPTDNARRFVGRLAIWEDARDQGSTRVQDFPFVLFGLAGACLAECDGSGVLDVADFFCFLVRYTTADVRSDLNADGLITVDDFFTYLTAYANGC